MTTGFASWRTLLAGLLGAAAIIAPHLKAAIDGDPATVCDWNVVIGAFIGLGGLGWFARDDSVSSEQAKVQP